MTQTILKLTTRQRVSGKAYGLSSQVPSSQAINRCVTTRSPPSFWTLGNIVFQLLSPCLNLENIQQHHPIRTFPVWNITWYRVESLTSGPFAARLIQRKMELRKSQQIYPVEGPWNTHISLLQQLQHRFSLKHKEFGYIATCLYT